MLSKYNKVLVICALYALTNTPTILSAAITKSDAAATQSAASLQDEGDYYFDRGFYAQAIQKWRDQYKQLREAQDLSGQISMLYKIATAQRMLGQHDRAIQGLEVASKLVTLTDDANFSLMIRANLGGAYLYTGQYNLAKPLLVDALYTAEKTGNQRLSALIHNDLGNLYTFTGQPEKGFDAFYKSANLAKSINDNSLVLQALTNAMILASDQNQPEQALSDLAMSLNFIAQMAPSYQKAFTVEKIASAAYGMLEKYEPSDASSIASIVKVVSELGEQAHYAEISGNGWLAAKLLMTQANYYEFAKQYEDALTLAKKAIFHSQLISDNNLTYRLEWQVARINNVLKNETEAAAFYRRAIETLQPVRHLLYDDPLQTGSYEKEQGNVYLQFADLLLRKAHNSDAPDSVKEFLLEARNVLERQKAGELQDYFKNQCAVETRAKTISIEDAIDESTAVIYPVLLPDRTELLVSYKSGIKQYVVEKPQDYVTEQIRNLRIKLEKHSTRDYLVYAKDLYQVLIAPLEKDLSAQQVKTLVFVPGQSLRTIPISVLHDGSAFLIDKYAVATTPGITLTDPRPLTRKNMKVLLSGVSEPVQGYPPLDYVPVELEQIQDLYGAKMLLNQSFDKNSVTNELQQTNYSVAHFASHAEFSGDVRKSFILTFDDRLSVNQLGQTISIGQSRNRPIELLTLSACNTAAGDDRAALGLAGIAIQSGARSALASLWAINDKASSMLVTEFYRQLQDEQVTKAVALQRAQQKLLQDVRYRHPGYWSPFLLIGNWL
ncbi:MAG: CHAT domain-containing protein [Gammaproteobacteria bacterium]|nr:CHAT domain-containing protein [Gammaproteobacteria bacterium]